MELTEEASGRMVAGHEMICKFEAGVARQPIADEDMGWLRMVADHAAAAIANGRAFAEIESLRKRLELENEYLREEAVGAAAFGELIGQSAALEAIGEIPLELQAKLLRVLQEGELERVGEERTRRVDVRLVAATNRDLRSEAEAGRFRQDLFYRLSVFPIEVPALRKRKEDIPLLVEHFLRTSSRKVGRPTPPLTLAAVQRLQQYDWPGNVRELQHVIERAVITSTKGRLNIELPSMPKASRVIEMKVTSEAAVRTDAQIRQIEADNIRAALKAANGKVSGPGGAAELLGLKPTTLASRIKALGIALPELGEPPRR